MSSHSVKKKSFKIAIRNSYLYKANTPLMDLAGFILICVPCTILQAKENKQTNKKALTIKIKEIANFCSCTLSFIKGSSAGFLMEFWKKKKQLYSQNLYTQIQKRHNLLELLLSVNVYMCHQSKRICTCLLICIEQFHRTNLRCKIKQIHKDWTSVF